MYWMGQGHDLLESDSFDASALIGNVHIHQDEEDRSFFTLHDCGAFKRGFLKQGAETKDMETAMSELEDEVDHTSDQNNQGVDTESRQKFLALVAAAEMEGEDDVVGDNDDQD